MFFAFLVLFPQLLHAASGDYRYSKLDELYFEPRAASGSNYFVANEVCSPVPLPVPSNQQVTIAYDAIANPVRSTDIGRARPIGLGPIASGGNTLNIRVGIEQFEGPVDIYLIFNVSTDPLRIFLLNQNLTFQPFLIDQVAADLAAGKIPAGFNPWRRNVTGPISNQSLFGSISTAALPKGAYTLFLLVTPTGSLESHFLWLTSFVIP